MNNRGTSDDLQFFIRLCKKKTSEYFDIFLLILRVFTYWIESKKKNFY